MLSTINRPMAGTAVTLTAAMLAIPTMAKSRTPVALLPGAADEPHGQNGGQSGAGQRTDTGGE